MSEFCRDASIAAGLPLPGTAVRVDLWVGLEHPRRWERNPADSPGLDTWVSEWIESCPGARLQLLRHEVDPAEPTTDSRKLFLAGAGPTGTWMREHTITDLEELRALDLEAIARAPETAPGLPALAPLAWVCTHGRRDPCCAKFGMPVYHALRQRWPDRVWQTSHLGGHRFAATLAILPAGLHYGHVTPAEACEVMAAIDDGRLAAIDRLRGRASLSAPAQTAEIALRRTLAVDAIEAPQVLDETTLGETRWRVRLRVGSAEATFEVERQMTEAATPAGCGGAAKPGPRYLAELVA